MRAKARLPQYGWLLYPATRSITAWCEAMGPFPMLPGVTYEFTLGAPPCSGTSDYMAPEHVTMTGDLKAGRDGIVGLARNGG